MSAQATEGFHHVTMVCADARRTRAFYTDLLGLPLVKETVNFDDPKTAHLYFGHDGGVPGTLLTFFEWSASGKGRWGIGGVHHVALEVADADSQLRWKRRLTDAGVQVSGPYDRGYFKSIYFADPDGQILEIATKGPGYAVDEAITALGTKDTLPPTAQLGGARDEAAIAAQTYPQPVPDLDDSMSLQGIHHVSGITEDVLRAGEFYEQFLGLRLVKRSFNQDDQKTPHWFWASYDGTKVSPRSSLTLFEWKGLQVMPRQGVGQTHHIAFRARDTEHQAQIREALIRESVDVSEVLDRRYFKSIYFRDPDGLLCEVATDGPGFSDLD